MNILKNQSGTLAKERQDSGVAEHQPRARPAGRAGQLGKGPQQV